MMDFCFRPPYKSMATTAPCPHHAPSPSQVKTSPSSSPSSPPTHYSTHSPPQQKSTFFFLCGDDDNDDANDPESEDEPMPGVEHEREHEHDPPAELSSKVDSGTNEKAKLVNGVKEASTNAGSLSPSSSPINQPPQLKS